MAQRKVGLIGAGNIGGEVANQIVAKALGDVVLLHLPGKENATKGKALPPDRLEATIARTRAGGGEIVALSGTSAHYAPAASAMAEAYLLDQKRLLPCAAYVNGEYGFAGLYLGVPVILGARGVEKVVEIPLTREERSALAKSATGVRSLIEVVERS